MMELITTKELLLCVSVYMFLVVGFATGLLWRHK